MRIPWRKAALAGLVPLASGCGEPSMPPPLKPELLRWQDQTDRTSLNQSFDPRLRSAKALNAAWMPPSGSPWLPYHKTTLLASISILGPHAYPTHRSTDEARLAGIARFLEIGIDFPTSAFIIDLQGAESVLWGVALARRGGTPIVTYNNWPHQDAVVRLEENLGALLHYADEIGAAPRSGPTPAFLLDSRRLMSRGWTPEADRFDNRYFHLPTDFPDAGGFKAAHVERVFYVVRRAGQEEDDLNEYFVALHRSGLKLFRVDVAEMERGEPGRGCTEYAPAARSTMFSAQDTGAYDSRSTGRSYSHYHHFWVRSRPTFGDGGPSVG